MTSTFEARLKRNAAVHGAAVSSLPSGNYCHIPMCLSLPGAPMMGASEAATLPCKEPEPRRKTQCPYSGRVLSKCPTGGTDDRGV